MAEPVTAPAGTGVGPVPRPVRVAVTATWAGVLVALVAGALFGGMVAGAWVSWDLLPALLGVRPGVAGLPVGAAAGLAAGFTVGHRTRGWVRVLRLHLLRRNGTHADARVTRVERRHRHTARGGSTTAYTVVVGWVDRDGAQGCVRHFRFLGDGDPRFPALLRTGATVRVAYRAGRAARAVLDVPYAPVLADLLP
ncbi:DUF3592 domain-containing protein [Actinocatenispora rupis]|uniref:DUF3592 domain-containing protein n=1 Tax=Actinocatenispora rupis TaxID=519421 RepID=A0A8J3NB61_9ACTN|nr:DUF3592 domain-containing protein [Actinocatenispora rupis]GID13039.1 hypothetical protein Aru02nite_39280 [Actinocatenispora rupis]